MPSLSQVKVTDFFHRLVSRPVLPPPHMSLFPSATLLFLFQGVWAKMGYQTGQGSVTATQPALHHLSPPRDPCPCSQPRIDGSW